MVAGQHSGWAGSADGSESCRRSRFAGGCCISRSKPGDEALIDGRTVLDPYFDPGAGAADFLPGQHGQRGGGAARTDGRGGFDDAMATGAAARTSGQATANRCSAGLSPPSTQNLAEWLFATDVNPSKVWTTYYASSMGSIGGGRYEHAA